MPISYDFRVEEREIVLPGWPRALDGLRVAHLSDIHVGGGMNRERLLRVAELTNARRPDLVAHTGDFLTHRSGDFDAPLYEALARVRAPLGQWACLGNHDYDDPERLVRRLGDAGVTVLRDRLTRDRGRRPAARDRRHRLRLRAPRARAARYARLVAAWPPRDGAPRLLLNHDPSAFACAARAARRPGAVRPHPRRPHRHPARPRRTRSPSSVWSASPTRALFARGDMRLFVTRCVGFYGYPMRVGIPPEIAVLVLRAPGRVR